MQQVNKKDFLAKTAFLLDMNRNTKDKVKDSVAMVNNLQWKYENLDTYYAPRSLVEEMAAKMTFLEKHINEI